MRTIFFSTNGETSCFSGQAVAFGLGNKPATNGLTFLADAATVLLAGYFCKSDGATCCAGVSGCVSGFSVARDSVSVVLKTNEVLAAWQPESSRQQAGR